MVKQMIFKWLFGGVNPMDEIHELQHGAKTTADFIGTFINENGKEKESIKSNARQLSNIVLGIMNYLDVHIERVMEEDPSFDRPKPIMREVIKMKKND